MPSWGAAAKAVSDIVEVVASDEASAKAAWLSRLDAPTWGAAAQGVSAVVEEAAKMAHLAEECNSGVNTACEMLSAEDQAKKVWLAKLDVPTWAKVSSAVMEVADVAAATVTMNESDAKAAWLAKLDDGRYHVEVIPHNLSGSGFNKKTGIAHRGQPSFLERRKNYTNKKP